MQQESSEQENADGHVDYHVMDINPVGNDDDEDEMLDEDEIKERKANMLKELIEKIEREEGGSANF